jgi:hypothetical protein
VRVYLKSYSESIWSLHIGIADNLVKSGLSFLLLPTSSLINIKVHFPMLKVLKSGKVFYLRYEIAPVGAIFSDSSWTNGQGPYSTGLTVPSARRSLREEKEYLAVSAVLVGLPVPLDFRLQRDVGQPGADLMNHNLRTKQHQGHKLVYEYTF